MFGRGITVPVLLAALLLGPMALLAVLKGMAGKWGGRQPYRVWTDDSGQFSARARLKSRDGASVILERADGPLVTVPLARLSRVDRSYLSGRKTEADDGSQFLPRAVLPEELFPHILGQWRYGDPADLWFVMVKRTPLWATLAIPLALFGIGLLLKARSQA